MTHSIKEGRAGCLRLLETPRYARLKGTLWGTYNAGQEVILGIDVTREGFDWALQHATLSRFTPKVHSSHDEWRILLAKSSVRVQWDPERDWRLNPISGVRAIQVGLSGDAAQGYVDRWIVRIEDVAQIAHQLADGLRRGTIPTARE